MKNVSSFLLAISLGLTAFAHADQVFMKDGTVYKGKIIADTEKAILIGNPPFDPNSYLLETKDIDHIVYEKYKPNAPSERRRGLTSALFVTGNVLSSPQLSFGTVPGLHGEIGFRLHPLFEITGGMHWIPRLSVDDGLLVTNATTMRRYQEFWQYAAVVSARIYPFFDKKKWKLEPYLLGGYTWDHLIPKKSGDSLYGKGWRVGAGAIYPMSAHWFLDARFAYDDLSFDTILFQDRESSIRPNIDQRAYALNAGLSFRL